MPPADPLSSLVVLDRLEVGPVRVEKARLVAPYRVARGRRHEETELVYRYHEAVFDPEKEASVQLASLIAAQVALNYGLFCRQLVLHGPFDAADRRFLTDMAANTAREIYVKKFLEPNPFLVGPAASLPAVKRESYLASEVLFPEAADDRRPAAAEWPTHRQRVAVLSSGGKDSLLSHGLLRELGAETHSLFVNESGRHWYTALNAYRHLAAERPAETARVWTSCDRVFTWMLRHLPFVRRDFARLRSDEYPIRLWTVAVFLFGVLPIVRKRGIARLVIGDEYDTTRRLQHEGITHYDGLFDQSRFFDDALSRYYQQKRWGLVQFSLLRPLSELLIQRILAERYPDLHRQQVSCHAAHLEGGRVLPCGRCEKCRRIVGMLLAYAADPGVCGYKEAEVASCLEALAAKGVHQEAAGAEHMAWRLREGGILPAAKAGGRTARPRPEVVQLRFHDDASPPDAIPADLREGLFRIYLQYAEGAVRRRGKMWVPCDPLAPEFLAAPYRFESPPSRRLRDRVPGGAYLLAELSWPQAKERFRETDTALLPVGAIEQHGPHLPLDLDAWDADYLCRKVAERCRDPKPLVLPLIPYGVSYHHDDFAGTLSVSPETLAQMVYEVGMAAARHGIAKLVIVNGHGGNAPTLQFAAQNIHRASGIFACVDTGETSDADIARLATTPDDVHAGEIETSTALATRPHLVHMEKARKAVPRFSSQYLTFNSERSVEWYAHTAKLSKSGILGDPTAASREKGEKMWEVMIEHLTAFVETLQRLSLDEIHQRRL